MAPIRFEHSSWFAVLMETIVHSTMSMVTGVSLAVEEMVIVQRITTAEFGHTVRLDFQAAVKI